MRVGAFLYEIDAKHANEHILIVTHEGTAYSAQNIAYGDSKDVLLKKEFDPAKHLGTAQYLVLDFANIPHDSEYQLDFHRPYIDEVVFTVDGHMYTRCPEVLDVWYDAGSMPFASVQYLFDNDEEFKKTLTVDFVAEGLDQTRGWFYSMLVMSVALFDQAPFKNVVVNGLVLAEDGRKMSKSLKNFPDLLPVAEQYGADALRFYFLASQVVRAEEFAYSPKGIVEVNNKLINKLLNTVSLLEMYGVKGGEIKPQKDHIHVIFLWFYFPTFNAIHL